MPECPVCGAQSRRAAVYDRHGKPTTIRATIRRRLESVLQALPRGVPLPPALALRARSPFRGGVDLCGSCGHGVMQRPPSDEELEAYYRSQYWSERPRTEEGGERRGSLRGEAQIELLLRCREAASDCERLPKSSLEIGAAYAGATLRLQALAGRDLQAAVCEPGDHWSAHYERHGITRVARFYPYDNGQRYQHLHTSHWLEHVRDLKEVIQVLVSQMEPGGTLFVEVPNCGADYWDLPLPDSPHIHFFSRDSLREAFCGAGLRCLHVGEYGIRLAERAAGRRDAREQHGEQPQGIWLRAVFQQP